MIKSGIYKITNNINGKTYIGQSVDIFKRWYEHRYKSNYNKDVSYNSALHAAFRKYGITSFSFEIVEECAIKDLDEREKYWIAKLNTLVPSGYNILTGGQTDKSASAETLEAYAEIKIKKQKLCKVCSRPIRHISTYCKKCLNKLQEKPVDVDELSMLVFTLGSVTKAAEKLGRSSASIIKKLRKSGLPYHTADLKQLYCSKNGITLPVKISRPKWETRFKPVVQMSKDGKVIREFKSVREAARVLGKNSGGLVMHLKGKLKSFAGYIWSYK